jgi:hypothetical protein
MRLTRNTIVTLVAGVLLGGTAFAQTATKQECAPAKECPTSKKINELLAGWDALGEQSRSVAHQLELDPKVASVAEKCPIGSRLGAALPAIRDVLAFVEASQKAGAEHCTLEKASHPNDSYAEAMEMNAMCVELVGKLHRLASYASGATCAEGSAAKGAESTVKATCKAGSVAGDKSACCPIRIASRIGASKASFATACAEAKALSDDTRKALAASFESLSEKNKAVALVPASVCALAEGLDGLNQLHARMAAWGEANPEFLSSVPESAIQSFMIEVALIDEARGLLATVSEAMKTMDSPDTTALATPVGVR